MTRAGSGLVAAVLGLALLTPMAPTAWTGAGVAAEPEPGSAPEPTRAVLAADPVDLPRPVKGGTALRLLGDRVDEAAAINGMRTGELRETLRADPTAWLTSEGLLHFKEPIAEPAAAAPVAASYPLEDTFALHSLPGSAHTIFIDVDGAQVSDTEWHEQYPTTPTTQPAWDPAGDGAGFSDAEKALVQAVWERVAEDYAPFDVDVTTEDPGDAAILRSDWTDEEYGARALVTPSTAWSTLCDQKCGGVAFIGVFDQPRGPGGDGYGSMQPAWVFPQGTGNSPKAVAEALSHEVGHQLGLTHDGNAVEGYDVGHGSWAPIMGLGYYRPLSQWSQGSYAGANNHQDDVAIIDGVLGSRPDEAPSGVAGAGAVPLGAAYVGSRTDVDTYLLGTCQGSVTVGAQPTLDAGADLDLRLQLLDTDGTVVASDDPASATVDAERASGLGASVTASLTSGRYHVAVDGVGHGSWDDGYDDYGSLGGYTVTVSGDCSTAGLPGQPDTLAASGTTPSSVTLSWSAPTDPGSSAVTGYVVSRTGSAQVVELGAGATSYTWTGLGTGTSYTFTVAAVNGSGTGARATVGATTVETRPSAPQDVVSAWNDITGAIDLDWSAPASDGGHPVTEYALYVDGYPLATVAASWRGVSISGAGPGNHTLGVAAVNETGTGPIASAVAVVPTPPAHDAFVDRAALDGASGSRTDDNTAATAEEDDPYPPSAFETAGGASLWYSWTAPISGQATVATGSDDPDRDTLLAAYTGSSLATLTEVAGNDDVSASDFRSRISFPVEAGTTYVLGVDGYRNFRGGTGPFTLTWSIVPPPAATTTTLSTSVSGRTVTLSATVSSGAGTPAGSVVLSEGAAELATLPLVAGVADHPVAAVPGGAHQYTATFVPTDTTAYAGSSGQSSLTMPAAPTTVTVEASVSGRTVTITATASSGAGVPVGSAVVEEDGVELDSVPLVDGSAELVRTDAPVGDHDYVVRFVPDDAAVYAASTSSTLSRTVLATATVTSLAATASGTAVTLTATVTAGPDAAAGSVRFRDAGVLVGTAPVTDGTAVLRLTGVTAGSHSYTATFLPSGTDQLSSTSPTRTVTVSVPRAGSLTVIKAPRTAKAGSRPTVRVTVRRGSAPATGSVVLTIGSKRVTLTLRAGVASYRLARVKAGKLKLSATYLGNATTVASKATATITVRKR